MKFAGLIGYNFMGFERIGFNLKDRGLVLLQGDNRDDSSANSNGAGKSTITDALYWGLFGETARGDKGDAVVNNKIGKDCSITVFIVDDDGSKYKIVRNRKHRTESNNLSLFKDGDDITKGTTALTQKEIERVLGCTRDVFDAAVYFAQEKLPDLPSMTDKNLKVLIEEAAGIKTLEAAYEEARSRLKNVEKSLAEEQALEKMCESAVDTLARQIKTLTDQLGDWEKERGLTLTEIKGKIIDRKLSLNQIKEELLKFDEALIQKNMDEINGRLEGFGTEREKLAEYEVCVSLAKSDVMLFESSIERLERDKAVGERNVLRVNSKVGSPCGECGKEIQEEDLSDVVASFQKTIAEKTSEIESVKEALAEAREKLSKAQEERDSYASSMSDPTALNREKNALSEKLAEIKKLQSNQELLKKTIEKEAETYKELKAKKSPLEPLLRSFKDNLDSKSTELENVRKQIGLLLESITTLKKVVEVFSPSGVRAHILDTVTPFLNARTSEYLGELSDGNISATWNTLTKTAKGEYKEKFVIEVSNDKGAKSYNSLSGGEKRKVRLATAMALQDLVASRATKPIKFMACDEIDDSLDSAGLERLMNILNLKAMERETVLVISHNDLGDYIRNVVTVVKEGGFSKITA